MRNKQLKQRCRTNKDHMENPAHYAIQAIQQRTPLSALLSIIILYTKFINKTGFPWRVNSEQMAPDENRFSVFLDNPSHGL